MENKVRRLAIPDRQPNHPPHNNVASTSTTTPVLALSDAALLTMAWFMVIGGDDQFDSDEAFRQTLLDELYRRGVLNKPSLTHDSININSLDESTLDSFAEMFIRDCDPSLEDSFVKATLADDRFAENSRCAECSHGADEIDEDEPVFAENGQHFHADCFVVGESFEDLQLRSRWLLRLVTEAFRTFLTEYPAGDVPTLAAGFMRDFNRDFGPLMAEVSKIRQQAAKLTPEETAELFRPIRPPSE
jgi:hypothetical protein